MFCEIISYIFKLPYSCDYFVCMYHRCNCIITQALETCISLASVAHASSLYFHILCVKKFVLDFLSDMIKCFVQCLQ